MGKARIFNIYMKMQLYVIRSRDPILVHVKTAIDLVCKTLIKLRCVLFY